MSQVKLKLKLHLEQGAAMPVTSLKQRAQPTNTLWVGGQPARHLWCCVEFSYCATVWFCVWAASPHCRCHKCIHLRLEWLLNTCGTS